MVVTFAMCRVAMFPFMYWCYGVQYGSTSIDADSNGVLVPPIVSAIKLVPRHCTIGSSLVLLPQLYWLTLMVKTSVKMIFGTDKPKAN